MYLIFIALIGIGIYFIVRGRTDISFPQKSTAVDILDKRFVNGDIDEETYRKIKDALKG